MWVLTCVEKTCYILVKNNVFLGMVFMKKRDITVDTNIIQSLYQIMVVGMDSTTPVMQNYTQEQLNSLKKLAKNLDKYCIHITPTVEKEILKYAKKNPGIIAFMQSVLKIPKAKQYDNSPILKEHILGLQKEYLKADIYLSDSTHKPQQALLTEVKNGANDADDSLIIAENSVLYGYPFFTLNEKHLISMAEAQDRCKPYRSKAVLDKNRRYLKQVPHKHSVIRKNLKAQHSTTFRIGRVFDKELFE